MIKFEDVVKHFELDYDVTKFIFNRLVSEHSTDMQTLGFGADDDFELYINSYQKTLSLTFEYYYNMYKDEETGFTLICNKLGDRIYTKYMPNWLKLAKAINADYNPIENYSMIEEENQGSEIVVDSSNENNVFGYNTTNIDGVPDTKAKGKSTSTGDYDKNHRKLTRSGNIGVTTSQQMIESQITLSRHKLLDLIYKDLNEFLYLSIYTK